MLFKFNIVAMIRLVLILTIFYAVAAYPQSKLSGTIVNSEGTPIEGAQVILSVADSIAAFAQSGTDGTYLIVNVTNGNYKVEVSMLGFATKLCNLEIGKDTQADFKLKTISHILDTLTIETKRPRVTTSTGHIYYLSKKAQKCGDPFKALQEVPDIISNHVIRSVQSTDGQPLLVLIDGVMINSGIATIDPKQIDYVEINDVVSARYIRMGIKKILNIHLKPKKMVYTFYEYGLRNDFPIYSGSTWGKFEIGDEKISLYMDLGPEYTHEQKTYNESWMRSDYYIKALNTESRQNSVNWDYNMLLKYRPTGKDYLAVYFQGNNNKQHVKTDGVGTFDYLGNDYTVDNTLTTFYRGDTKSNIYAGTLFYRRKINDKMTFENYLSCTYNFNRLETYNHDKYPIDTWEERIDFRTRRNTFSQSADYSWDINDNIAFSAGNNTLYTYDRLHDLFSDTPVYRHNEWNEFVYVTVSGRIKKFLFMVSAGYEGIWRTSAKVFNHYSRPYSVMTLTYDMGKAGSLRGKYYFNSAPPAVSMLNPYDTSTDSLRRNIGNPYLKPQNTNSVGLGYSFFNNGLYANADLDYTCINNRFENIGYIDENGIYTSTYLNLGYYSNLLVSLSVGYRNNNTTIGTYFQRWYEYYPGNKAKKSFSISAYALHSLKKWTLYTSFGYTDYSYTNISSSYDFIPSVQLSLSYQATPNLSLTLGTDAIVKYTKSKVIVKDIGFEMHTLNKKDVLHPFLLVRWTLRKNSKKKIKLNNNIMKGLQEKINLQDRKY